jgi:hypothetical protein
VPSKIEVKLGRINWYPLPLDLLLKQPGGTLGRYLAKKGRKVVIAAKAQAGVKTGQLKASIKILTHDRALYGQKMTIGSKVNHAYIHHQGTRPHVIMAKPGKHLRFTSRGRVVYARRVMHPGTKPNKYLADNLYLIL